MPVSVQSVKIIFGDRFAKELKSIPLSNDIIVRQIDNISNTVKQQQ